MQQEEPIRANILAKSLGDILPNLLFFGIGVPIVIFLGRWVRLLGVLGFAAYAFILFTDLLRIAVQLVTGAILLFGMRSGGAPSAKAQAISWVTTLVQIIETVIFAAYTAFLYRALFS